jgi:hypothetical protein
MILARVCPSPRAGPKRTSSGLVDGTEPAGPTQQIVLQSPVVVALGAPREVTLAEGDHPHVVTPAVNPREQSLSRAPR